jgi:serine protease inhibitor
MRHTEPAEGRGATLVSRRRGRLPISQPLRPFDRSGDGGLAAVDCATAGAQDLVTADTAFAPAFFAPAVAQAGGSSTNAIVSPYSVSDAMMMVDVGAAGETSSQIESVLSLSGTGTAEAPAYAGLACALETDGSSNGNALYVANSLWGQQGESFEAPFLDVLGQGYGAPLQTVDFENDATAAICRSSHSPRTSSSPRSSMGWG